jgi:hypothetical protein
MMTNAFAGMSVLAQSGTHASPPVGDVGTAIVALDASRGAGVYAVYGSADLLAGSTSAHQALVIIHGRLRNASDYFTTGLALAKAAGPAGESTIVVAPQFLNPADVAAHHLPDRYLRWNDDWGDGVPALGPSPSDSTQPAASAYDVLDDIVAKLSNTSAFPELRRIVFVGHGGGAQMLTRYAIVMRSQPGPAVSFVIANPGTYLYPMTARPVPPSCPDFNLWKYGLDKPPPYVKDLGNILKRFAARDVTLLLGTKDKKTNGVLDRSCPAQAQGRTRFERGQYFLRALAASGLAPLLKHAIVQGVGHNEQNMLLSREARDAIFVNDKPAR